MSVSAQEIRNAITQVKEILDTLESKLAAETGAATLDPYARRKQLLQRIYWQDNNVHRNELMDLLHEFGTNYAWIGQQVRKGYLVVLQAPGGTRYSVTQKAIREEGLQEEEADIDRVAALSVESFADDWDSEEDSAYDAI